MKEGTYKAKGGLIRVSVELRGEVIGKIVITGDFFFYPEEELENLENALLGRKADEKELNRVIVKFYREKKIKSPGLKPSDFVEAIKEACMK